MPRGGWILLAALATFAIVVLGVVAWAGLTGRAGSQRGLVIHSVLREEVRVGLADGQTWSLLTGDEHVFVVKRKQFPSEITVRDAAGRKLYSRTYEYDELADAEFRLTIDDRGFFPTSSYRDTPVPTQSLAR